MRDLDDQALNDWCRKETAYWSDLVDGQRDFDLDFERINELHHSIFILDIAAGRVSVRDKPSLSGDMFETGAQEYLRIGFYKTYIEECLRQGECDIVMTIAVDVHDIPAENIGCPLFCFQKTIASRNMLLPDVDFMQHGWYEQSYEEPSIEDKRPHGIFAGSSTGGGILTAGDVIEARTPRLRLSRDLNGHPDIDFTIAAVVQCDSPETEHLLTGQPYFSGPISWERQLAYRYLISIDGNGATCSRIVNSLRSKSVLLKFFSASRLYYFHGLEPWKHFVPVDTIQDIEQIIDEDRRRLTDLSHITRHANHFFETFLTRSAVHDYGARLLTIYARDIAPKGRPALARRRKNACLIADMSAHVADLGEVYSCAGEWIGDPGRRHAIEGIAINAIPGVDPALFGFRCFLNDGEATGWSNFGVFSGSRGQARAITGIEFSLLDTADGIELAGLLRFANGTVRTISPRGGLYHEPDGSPLTALKLWLS